MAAEDIVTYNGIEMRRDYAGELEATQLCTHYRGHGGLFARVPLGAQDHMTAYHRGRSRCRCCNTVTGQLHGPLCEGEECPRCGRQVMSCDCDFMTEDAVPGGVARTPNQVLQRTDAKSAAAELGRSAA